MPDFSNDKRHFHRIFYHADATLSGDLFSTPCKIIDLSLKGCLLQFKEPWTESLDTLYELAFYLSDDINIAMQLSVNHVIGNQVGFKAEHINIDSITRLRRLVELNLGDSEMLERDLLALTELHEHD